jgi:hypothetical protein
MAQIIAAVQADPAPSSPCAATRAQIDAVLTGELTAAIEVCTLTAAPLWLDGTLPTVGLLDRDPSVGLWRHYAPEDGGGDFTINECWAHRLIWGGRA